MPNSKNWNKKATLFASGLVCALCFRVPISTASFCVERFRLDLTMLGIYISRILNGIMMSWQLGQWTAISIIGFTGKLHGIDLSVPSGEPENVDDILKTRLQVKILVNSVANWLVLICFCIALFCFCHSEEGHLTAFYWSIITANFCWKWSEAFAKNIYGAESNWYIFTFGFSAIYTATLKGLLMLFVKYFRGGHTNPNRIFKFLGTNSVETTVEYIVPTGMILLTIILSVLTCVFCTPNIVKTNEERAVSDASPYDVYEIQEKIFATIKQHNSEVLTQLQTAAKTVNVTTSNNQLAAAIRKVGSAVVKHHSNGKWISGKVELDFTKGTVASDGVWVDSEKKILINVNDLNDTGDAIWNLRPFKGNEQIKQEMLRLLNNRLAPQKVSLKSVDAYKGVAVHGKTPWHVRLTLEETNYIQLVVTELKSAARTLKDADDTDNELVTAIKTLGANKEVYSVGKETLTFNFTKATVNPLDAVTTSGNNIQITVKNVLCIARSDGWRDINSDGKQTLQTAKELKKQLDNLIPEKIANLRLTSGTLYWSKSGSPGNITIAITLKTPEEMEIVLTQLQTAAKTVNVTTSNNQLAAAIQTLKNIQKVNTTTGGGEATLNFGSAEVNTNGISINNNKNTITIAINNVTSHGSNDGWRSINNGKQTSQTSTTLKTTLDNLIGTGKIRNVDLTGNVWVGNAHKETMLGKMTAYVDDLRIKVTLNNAVRDWVTGELNLSKSDLQHSRFSVKNKTVTVKNVASTTHPNNIDFSLDRALMLDGQIAATLKTDVENKIRNVKGLIVGVDASSEESKITITAKDTEDVNSIDDLEEVGNWAQAAGLGGGSISGALLGLIISSLFGSVSGNIKSRRLSGLCGGGLVGALVGIIGVEIHQVMHASRKQEWTVWCSLIMNILGQGTIYSVYPGMAPCSITNFSDFNRIDLFILILSAIPLFIFMGLSSVGYDPEKNGSQRDDNAVWRIWYFAMGLVFLATQNTSQIITIFVLHNPDSRIAQKVSLSPLIAGIMTVVMQISDYIATSLGFSIAEGRSTFNESIFRLKHTATLFVAVLMGLLGEGYLTELKKYEPGMWPSQRMGKCEGLRWWFGRVSANAWQIMRCICTKDLRRDITMFGTNNNNNQIINF